MWRNVRELLLVKLFYRIHLWCLLLNYSDSITVQVKTREMSEVHQWILMRLLLLRQRVSTPHWVPMQLRFSRCSNQDVTFSFREVRFITGYKTLNLC